MRHLNSFFFFFPLVVISFDTRSVLLDDFSLALVHFSKYRRGPQVYSVDCDQKLKHSCYVSTFTFFISLRPLFFYSHFSSPYLPLSLFSFNLSFTATSTTTTTTLKRDQLPPSIGCLANSSHCMFSLPLTSFFNSLLLSFSFPRFYVSYHNVC